MNNSPSLDRQLLRSRFLARRNMLSCADRTNMSRQIITTLIALPIFKDKKHFFIYCSYRSEVETILLLNHCLREGKTVCVPLTVPKQSRLLAVAITDSSTDLAPGFMGIPEPLLSLEEHRLVPPNSIEVAVIPGAVFARSGHRLGYGGGYYDRFLAQTAPQSFRIGLSYSSQLIDHIPVLPHDVPMDMLITEREVLLCPSSNNANNNPL